MTQAAPGPATRGQGIPTSAATPGRGHVGDRPAMTVPAAGRERAAEERPGALWAAEGLWAGDVR